MLQLNFIVNSLFVKLEQYITSLVALIEPLGHLSLYLRDFNHLQVESFFLDFNALSFFDLDLCFILLSLIMLCLANPSSLFTISPPFLFLDGSKSNVANLDAMARSVANVKLTISL